MIPDEFMLRFFTTALVALLISLTSAHAGDRTRIGYGRLITNDFIGDGKDRWRSGAVAQSRLLACGGLNGQGNCHPVLVRSSNFAWAQKS